MKSILETIRQEATLKTLAEYLDLSGLAPTLAEKGPFTLFAPNDAAFVRMNIAAFLKDPKNLSDTLYYHLAAGAHGSADISSMETLETENGKSLTIALDEGEIVVDNAKYVTTDILCSNGVIHIMDNVFQPQLSGWYREE